MRNLFWRMLIFCHPLLYYPLLTLYYILYHINK
nr:MAG TPA: hypothetical protein [Caudoviricetes sp.]